LAHPPRADAARPGKEPAPAEERGSGEPTPVNLDAQELARIRASLEKPAKGAPGTESTSKEKTRSLGKSAALLARLRKAPSKDRAEEPAKPQLELDKQG